MVAPSESSSAKLGLLVFPQEDPSAYLQVQVGAFESQPPEVVEYSQLVIPGPPVTSLGEPQESARGLTEKGFILGLNFPESPGPPAALQLTAPWAPLSFMSPLRGNWRLAPTKEISC